MLQQSLKNFNTFNEYVDNALGEYNKIIPSLASSEPWKNPNWLDENGKCWMGHPGDGNEWIPSWRYCCPEDAPNQTCSLPYWFIPQPKGT